MTKHIPDRFTLGHSPDPDDAFMFYAMAENKIDLRGYRFDHRLEDIQTLNERARRGELHISAISIHAYAYVVVSFDKIFDAVKSGPADAGLIIHEGQLTYAQAGFEKIVDLGEWWKRETGLPLPLGGNVVRKDIPPAVRRDLSEIIRESIDYGLAHRNDAVRHSLPYARDMDAQLAGKFIGMYVNEFTRDYGEIGRAAIRKFLGDARDKGYINASTEVEFVE